MDIQMYHILVKSFCVFFNYPKLPPQLTITFIFILQKYASEPLHLPLGNTITRKLFENKFSKVRLLPQRLFLCS